MRHAKITCLLLTVVGVWVTACGGNASNDATHATANGGKSGTAIVGGFSGEGGSVGSIVSGAGQGGLAGNGQGGTSQVATSTGGVSQGGLGQGGVAQGGSSTGGRSQGGASQGGLSTGGLGQGGSSQGGSKPSGGSAGVGRTSDSTGAAASGGSSGSSSTSGGAAMTGGTSSIGGSSTGCTGCQALEQCFNGTSCVAKSVSVPAGFSVDATEVTRGQYAAWLATKPATAGQATFCTWNASYTPDATCMADHDVCQGSGCENHPQPCVDWCDAIAYCQAVGRSLCSDSQWDNACTSDGVNQVTYGSSFVRDQCNDYTFVYTTTVPVGSMPGCQSPVAGYAGIFDLIGNLGEWTDNCHASNGQDDVCGTRGLSFGQGAAAPICSQSIPMRRGVSDGRTGFRCCSSQ